MASASFAFCSTSAMETPLSVDGDDALEQLLGGERRQAGGGLVQQQHGSAPPSAPWPWRASGARRRTACARRGGASRPARESARSTASMRCSVACRIDVAAHLQVLAHRHGREDVVLLRHVGEAAPADVAGGKPGDVGALQLDAAAARAEQAGDGLEQRRLAGAVRADDADDLARHAPRNRRLSALRRPRCSRRRCREQRAFPSGGSDLAAAHIGQLHVVVGGDLLERALGQMPALGHARSRGRKAGPPCPCDAR